jgi:uncharacterized metal-binding protein YceD (DUF177 family)
MTRPGQQPEFSRPVRIDTLGPSPREVSIGANEKERAALARRFGLVAVDYLSAEAALTLNGDTVTAVGSLDAKVTQSCVASNLPVEAELDEEFRIVFRPQPQDGRTDEEIELSEGELDVVFYSGGSIDLGEAIAETLSLSLDPYPRSPESDAALRDSGVKSEAEAGPFAALAALKDKLKP